MTRFRSGAAILVATVALGGCSMKKMGMARMADAVSATATTFSTDDDPEFVRLAAPSTLKIVEMLLEDDPRHPGLLLTACSGFTQYAYAFLQVEAELSEASNPPAARELRTRASRMYDRSRAYCLRALDAHTAGASAALPAGKIDLLRRIPKTDVAALYWLGAAWGGSLTLAENPILRLREIAVLRAIFLRALELDSSWESGAIHEGMIAIEGLPPLVGGSPARAREHFDQAVALSNGQSAFAYVTLATSVAQPAKNRAEFEKLLRAALNIDASKRPPLRLANLIAQKRARVLLSQMDRLF
ncbi:MAG TPA: TRAP transporter TatT component family protein [Vicinamibacterales bacterium]|nr:TRAP transporter TatT component family protein [Vicinamibacterales bacterium]